MMSPQELAEVGVQPSQVPRTTQGLIEAYKRGAQYKDIMESLSAPCPKHEWLDIETIRYRNTFGATMQLLFEREMTFIARTKSVMFARMAQNIIMGVRKEEGEEEEEEEGGGGGGERRGGRGREREGGRGVAGGGGGGGAVLWLANVLLFLNGLMVGFPLLSPIQQLIIGSLFWQIKPTDYQSRFGFLFGSMMSTAMKSNTQMVGSIESSIITHSS